MLRRVCISDVNLAVTVLWVNAGSSHGTEDFIAMVGSGSDIRRFSPSFGGSRQKEISALRLRDYLTDILIVFVVRSLILLVGWNHNIFRVLCSEDFHSKNRVMPTPVQIDDIHVGLFALFAWLWPGSFLVKVNWRWNLAHSDNRVTFLMGFKIVRGGFKTQPPAIWKLKVTRGENTFMKQFVNMKW